MLGDPLGDLGLGLIWVEDGLSLCLRFPVRGTSSVFRVFVFCSLIFLVTRAGGIGRASDQGGGL